MWTIECLVNTAVISNDCAHDLFEEAQDYEGELWGDYEEVIDKNVGLLRFNPDHMEGMDYLATHDNAIKILKRHNVKGDICFGSLDSSRCSLKFSLTTFFCCTRATPGTLRGCFFSLRYVS